jgi:3',5'-cyclic AMP phosphodiesterase CpdA
MERLALRRREFLAAAGAVSLVPSAAARADGAGTGRVPALRFAHLTDLHCCADRRAPEGIAATFRHLRELDASRPVELVVTGGDLIMDSFETSREEALAQWNLLDGLLREHCRPPLEHCLGNHDLWGWCRAKCASDGSEPDLGAGLACARLGLARPWRSFDRGGWHFVILQSVAPDPDDPCGYLGRLDAAQMAWLEADLAAGTAPTVVVSHIPILTVTPWTRGKGYDQGRTGQISGGLVHLDAQPLHRLFRRSGRVKLALSGHMHLIDRCVADGITYCCDGAVCGGWWKPDDAHCEPTYAVVDLFADGSFEHRMVASGWRNA